MSFCGLIKGISPKISYCVSVLNKRSFEPFRGEPVWPSGMALGWYAEGPRLHTASALLFLQKRLWFVDTVL